MTKQLFASSIALAAVFAFAEGGDLLAELMESASKEAPAPASANAVETAAQPVEEARPVAAVESVSTNDVAAAGKPAKKKSRERKASSRPARITSATTYYDRKEGIVFFNKDVYVDDEQYQLHADKAYVFLSGTNDVRRIVAIGNVAMTNDTKRAYGAKVSYYKEGGMVVLYSGDGIAAEVRDESKEQDQVVRGKKIKFWIDSEQVEVTEADISAPASGFGKDGLKKAMNLN